MPAMRAGPGPAGWTDLGELAHLALVESLTEALEPQLPSLFAPSPREIRTALGQLAGGNRFASFARTFFARLTGRILDYYLSRELAAHTGPGKRFPSDGDRAAFDHALATHAFETSRIVEGFAAGWYGKNVWQGDGPTREKIDGFSRFAFRKIRNELGRRQAA
jgi:hypothetical protein